MEIRPRDRESRKCPETRCRGGSFAKGFRHKETSSPIEKGSSEFSHLPAFPASALSICEITRLHKRSQTRAERVPAWQAAPGAGGPPPPSRNRSTPPRTQPPDTRFCPRRRGGGVERQRRKSKRGSMDAFLAKSAPFEVSSKYFRKCFQPPPPPPAPGPSRPLKRGAVRLRVEPYHKSDSFIHLTNFTFSPPPAAARSARPRSFLPGSPKYFPAP